MVMDPDQVARDNLALQLQGASHQLLVPRSVLWLLVRMAGGQVKIHPSDICALSSTDELVFAYEPDGSFTLEAK